MRKSGEEAIYRRGRRWEEEATIEGEEMRGDGRRRQYILKGEEMGDDGRRRRQ